MILSQGTYTRIGPLVPRRNYSKDDEARSAAAAARFIMFSLTAVLDT
jgi:hypothetical protein